MTATAEPTDVESQIRKVTANEVAAFQRDGWAELPGLVSPELAGRLLDRLKQLSGIELDELIEGDPASEAAVDRIGAEGASDCSSCRGCRMKRCGRWRPRGDLGGGGHSHGHSSDAALHRWNICKLPEWTGRAERRPGDHDRRDSVAPRHAADADGSRGGIQFWLGADRDHSGHGLDAASERLASGASDGDVCSSTRTRRLRILHPRAVGAIRTLAPPPPAAR